jgi:hypothetical protein
MAGDYFQKSTTGQRFAGIPSKLDNTLKDAARAFQADGLLSASLTGSSPEGLILVENKSGAAVQRFGVLGLSGVVITDSQNLPEFQNKWALTGVTPTAAYAGKFAIAWDPIANGSIGRAFVFGTCPCQVKMGSTTDPFADVLASDATQLQSGPTGSAQIIFCGSPIASGSGTYWCVVRLGPASQSLFPVIVAQSGGSDGAVPSTSASWTYNVYQIKPDGTQGTQLNTASSGAPLTVQYARMFNAPTVKATHGMAYYRGDGTLVLQSVDEGYEDEDVSCD